MRVLATLRGRLILSHLAAVFVGVLTIVLTAGPLTQRFFVDHVAGMGLGDNMMGGGDGPTMGVLERSLTDSFLSALVIALAASAVTAVLASVVAARRIAQPIERMSDAARKLALGEYRERVPVPYEAELATLAEDINTLAETLETTEDRRLRLINEVAHELRTPLTTIEGYMEGLLDGVFEPTEEVFGATAREAARLRRLATDLSDLSRAEEGALDLQMSQIDLGEVAVEAATALRPLFLEKDITFRVDGDAHVPVMGDRDRLTQVFTNILGNAITYTGSGGEVGVTIRSEGAEAAVTVTDNGKGIAREDLARVFDRFHRVDPSLP